MTRTILTTFLFLLIFVSGCASKQSLELAHYETANASQYPAISFILNNGYLAHGVPCYHSTAQHPCYPYIDNKPQILRSILEDTEMFEGVGINDTSSEFVFDIKFREQIEGKESFNFSRLMLGALSALLIPTVNDKKSSFSVAIKYKNKVIKDYVYQGEYTQTLSLFINPDSYKKNVMEYFVSLLIRDIQDDDVFSNVVAGKSNLKRTASLEMSPL